MTWDGYYEAPLAALQPSSQCGVFAAHAGKAFGSFDRESATEEFVGVLKAYRVTSVTGDRYPGQWCVQAFQKRGITYDHSELPKSGLYIDLLPELNSKTIKIPDYPKLVNQLAGLERRTVPGGKDSVDHSPGAHDDAANAVAGVAHCAVNSHTVIHTELGTGRFRGRW